MAPRPAHVVGWPLEGPDADGLVRFDRDEAAIRRAVWNLLMTRPGERLMRPGFGAGLPGFVHEPNGPAAHARIREAVEATLRRHERRILVERVDVAADPTDPTVVRVTVAWRLRRDLSPGAAVFDLVLAST